MGDTELAIIFIAIGLCIIILCLRIIDFIEGRDVP